LTIFEWRGERKGCGGNIQSWYKLAYQNGSFVVVLLEVKSRRNVLSAATRNKLRQIALK